MKKKLIKATNNEKRNRVKKTETRVQLLASAFYSVSTYNVKVLYIAK